MGFLNKGVKICLHKCSKLHEQSYSEFTGFNYCRLNPIKQGYAHLYLNFVLRLWIQIRIIDSSPIHLFVSILSFSRGYFLPLPKSLGLLQQYTAATTLLDIDTKLNVSNLSHWRYADRHIDSQSLCRRSIVCRNFRKTRKKIFLQMN